MVNKKVLGVMSFAWIGLFVLTMIGYTGGNQITGSAIVEPSPLPENITFGVFIALLGIIVTCGYLLHREYKEAKQL